MKIYIESAENTEDRNDIYYYNFCIDHKQDIENYISKTIQQKYGVAPYYCKIDMKDPNYKHHWGISGIYFDVYAKLDVLTQLTPECMEHVVFDGDEATYISEKLVYEDGKFYAELSEDEFLSLEGKTDLDSLSIIYDYIDEFPAPIENFRYFMQEREGTLQVVQHIYDKFKDKANLQFTITNYSNAYLKVYTKDTNILVYSDRCCYLGESEVSDERIQKLINNKGKKNKSNKKSAEIPAENWDSLEDWYFDSDDCEDVQRDFYDRMMDKLEEAYPDAWNIYGEPSVQGLDGGDFWSVILPDGTLSTMFEFEEEMEYMFENGAKDCADYYADRFMEDAEFEED